MYNSPHPGTILKERCQQAGLTVTAAAKTLGVARKTLSELVNGKAGVSPEMALRLAQAFKTTPEYWLDLQQQYDLARAKQKSGFQISEVVEPYGAKATTENPTVTDKHLLHLIIDSLSEEDVQQVLDYTRRYQESETLRRLAEDPNIILPTRGWGGYDDFEPMEVKGKPASELLIEDRRR